MVKGHEIPPEPQATPVEDSQPVALKVAQPEAAPDKTNAEVEAIVEERLVEEALVKVCKAVQLLALPKLISQSLIADEPS